MIIAGLILFVEGGGVTPISLAIKSRASLSA